MAHTLGWDDCGIPYGSDYCPQDNNWDGHEHRDEMKARGGNDTVSSDSRNDLINYGGAKDFGGGQWGDDDLYGKKGSDIVHLNGVTIVIAGEHGHDLVDGGPREDGVEGGQENDVILGGPGPDEIFADDGDRDYIEGNGGTDVCDVDPNKDIWRGCYYY